MTHTALSGRTAIVTGAGHGTGAAAARALSRAGASVVLAARDGAELRALVATIGSAGGHAVAVPTDTANPVSVRRLVEQTLGAFGRLDAAFNAHAGGVSLAMRYQIPPMRHTGGSIVNLAPDPATVELTRTAALACAGCGIRISALRPGPHSSTEALADAVVRLCSAGTQLLQG